MKSSTKTILSIAACSAIFASTQIAQAVPITGVYSEDPRCDVIPNQTLTHELGEVQFFPLNEAFSVNVSPATFTVCVPDDGIANDWIVQINNISGIAWTNLFFVGDLGLSVGNADGNVLDVINAPGVIADAFRIDGTVTAGINNNLLNESGVVDEIFSPGESWRFTVSNYFDPAGLAPAPIFRAPGVFGGSELYPNSMGSTASIIATPVPEPSTFVALLLPLGALLLRRRRRA